MFNRIKEMNLNKQSSSTSKDLHCQIEKISNKINQWKSTKIMSKKQKKKMNKEINMFNSDIQ